MKTLGVHNWELCVASGTDSAGKMGVILMACLTLFHNSGFLKPWDATLGSYNAASGTFTDRRKTNDVAGASSQDFCNIMAPGQIYVGTPGMSAICNALAEQTGIKCNWGAKVHPILCHYCQGHLTWYTYSTKSLFAWYADTWSALAAFASVAGALHHLVDHTRDT